MNWLKEGFWSKTLATACRYTAAYMANLTHIWDTHIVHSVGSWKIQYHVFLSLLPSCGASRAVRIWKSSPLLRGTLWIWWHFLTNSWDDYFDNFFDCFFEDVLEDLFEDLFDIFADLKYSWWYLFFWSNFVQL